MLSFLERIALESFGDFGIAFAIGLAAHGEVHTYFAAFTVEVGGEVGDHLFVATLGDTYLVFCNELEGCFRVEFAESGTGSAALGAFFGCFCAFVHIAAGLADKFLFHCRIYGV